MKNVLKLTAIGISVLSLAWFAIAFWGARSVVALETRENEEESEGRLAATIKGRYEQEFIMTHDPATNTIPRDRLLVAKRIADQKRAEMVLRDDAIPIYWNERGPNNIGGRTRSVLIDANDASGRTVFAASVSGGLWRTTNIDAAPPNWTLINDFFANLAIQTIAQDPSNSNTMYFGTGEESLNFADPVRGLGIWRSVDGGVNWARLPNATFTNVFKIAIANDGTVYAATDGGLQRSTDAGLNWTAIAQVPGSVQDVEIASNGDVFAGRNAVGAYRLQAGTWTLLASPSFPASGFGRVEVTCAPSAGGTVYVAFEKTSNPNSGSCQGVYQSTDGGNNWQAQTVPAAYGGQAWYNFAFSVDPNNASRIWLGGQGLAVSNDAGANWTTVNGVHSDHHIVLYRPGNSNDIVFGNDGGVYRCTNGTNANPTLTDKNQGYNVTQFYANALHPTAGSNYMLGGTQDNGTQRFNSAGIGATSQPSGAGGDGGFSFIDQDNANVQIAAYTNRLFFVSTDGGANFSDLTTTNAPSLFITPAEYDDAANIFYYSSNNDTLGRRVNVGGAGAETFERVTAFGGSKISNIAVSPNTANRIFVGTTNGSFVRIDNADQPGSITVNALTSPRNAAISCIAVEPGNDNHLIATSSNYGGGKVFESTDGGANWTNVTNDLPDMPVHWVMFNPFDHDQLMLATELGIWSTDDLNGGSTTWWPTNTFGLANVRVDMLQYRSSDHLVAAGTHGRGIYTTDYFTLLNTCMPNLFVGGPIPSGLYMAEDFITSTGVVGPGGKVIMQAGDYIDLKAGFWAQQGSDFWALIRECNISPAPQPFAWNLVERSRSESSGKSRDEAVQNGELGLNCFPNPATYQLFIEANLPQDGTYSLSVRNIQGRMIENFAANDWRVAGLLQIELNAENYAPGVYVLTLQTAKNTVTERFIVAR